MIKLIPIILLSAALPASAADPAAGLWYEEPAKGFTNRSCWATGASAPWSSAVIGLRARGGFTVDIEWQKGKVTNFRITSKDSQTVCVRVNGAVQTVKTHRGGL